MEQKTRIAVLCIALFSFLNFLIHLWLFSRCKFCCDSTDCPYYLHFIAFSKQVPHPFSLYNFLNYLNALVLLSFWHVVYKFFLPNLFLIYRLLQSAPAFLFPFSFSLYHLIRKKDWLSALIVSALFTYTAPFFLAENIFIKTLYGLSLMFWIPILLPSFKDHPLMLFLLSIPLMVLVHISSALLLLFAWGYYASTRLFCRSFLFLVLIWFLLAVAQYGMYSRLGPILRSPSKAWYSSGAAAFFPVFLILLFFCIKDENLRRFEMGVVLAAFFALPSFSSFAVNRYATYGIPFLLSLLLESLSVQRLVVILLSLFYLFACGLVAPSLSSLFFHRSTEYITASSLNFALEIARKLQCACIYAPHLGSTAALNSVYKLCGLKAQIPECTPHSTYVVVLEPFNDCRNLSEILAYRQLLFPEFLNNYTLINWTIRKPACYLVFAKRNKTVKGTTTVRWA